MQIPKRFQLKPIAPELLEKMSKLCDDIENASYNDEILANNLLAEWHQFTSKTYGLDDFQSYYSSLDKDDFIKIALFPEPVFDESLLYKEAKEVLEFLTAVEGSESEHHFYLQWLETQFPESNVCGLIYWPDQWFDDPSIFMEENGDYKDVEFTAEQRLAYMMQKSNRILSGAPEIKLPYPLPTKSFKSDVIHL